MNTNEEAIQRYTRRLIENIREDIRTNSQNLTNEAWNKYKNEMLVNHKDNSYSNRWRLNGCTYYSQDEFIQQLQSEFTFNEDEYVCKKIAKALNLDISDAESMLEDLRSLEEQEEKERQQAEELKAIHIKELDEEERKYILSLAISRFTKPIPTDKISNLYKVEEGAAKWIATEHKKYLDIREAKFKMLDTYIEKLQEKCMLKEIADLLGLSFKEAKEYVESRILEQEENSNKNEEHAC